MNRTELEPGHMKNPGKPRGQYYLAQQTTDSNCVITVGTTVARGDCV